MNQAAFVGFLVAVILVITQSLVVFGPQVGGAVAQYFICMILNPDSADCVDAADKPEPDTDPVDSPDGQKPDDVKPNTVLTTDLGDDCEQARANLEDMFPNGAWNADQFVAPNTGAPLPPMLPPAGPGPDPGAAKAIATMPSGPVGGTWSIGPDCSLSIQVAPEWLNRDEANTDFDWRSIGLTIASGVLAIATAALVDTFCFGLFPEAAVVCGALTGFAIGFFWNVYYPLLDKGTMTATDVVKAFAIGVISALPAGFVYGRFIGQSLVQALRGAEEVIAATETELPNWISNAIGDEAFNTAETWAHDMADLFENFSLEDLASGAAP